MENNVIQTLLPLHNQTGDELSSRILKVIGNTCIQRDRLDEDGTIIETWYELPEQDEFLLVESTTGWGTLTAAWMYDTHLILQVAIGGDVYLFSPTYSGFAASDPEGEWVNRLMWNNIVKAVAL